MKEAEALWTIATADEPLTIAEVAEVWDDDRTSASTPIRKLYAHGLLVRRRREVGKVGEPPYEYALARRDGMLSQNHPANPASAGGDD